MSNVRHVLILAAICAVSALAQGTSPSKPVHFVTIDPTGSCGNSYITVNTTTGAETKCVAGTWVTSSSGGSGTVTSVATSCGVSGGPITTTGTVSGNEAVDSQTGSGAFAIPSTDCGKTIQRNQASAVSDTIAQAGTGNFTTGWYTDYQCIGAGGCTITPATSTINGAASLTLTSGQGVRIVSDGTNYRIHGSIQGGITGSGTANQVAVFSGASAIGGFSTFNRDSTNGAFNVGATASAVSALDPNNLFSLTKDTTSAAMDVNLFAAGTKPTYVLLERSRGTPGSQMDVQSGDQLGAIIWQPWVGGSYGPDQSISGNAEGTPDDPSGTIPMNIELQACCDTSFVGGAQLTLHTLASGGVLGSTGSTMTFGRAYTDMVGFYTPSVGVLNIGNLTPGDSSAILQFGSAVISGLSASSLVFTNGSTPPALSTIAPSGYTLSPINGGTGVNNGSKTITLGGNFITTGAFNSTFAIPSTGTWTFPPPGSLAPLASPTFTGTPTFPVLDTTANCSSSASPAVCSSAAAGSVAIPTGVSSVALTVNTSAVTANSQIFLFPDDTLGARLGVTCNSTLATLVGGMAVTARTAGTSFTVTYNGTIATNPLCISYLIVN